MTTVALLFLTLVCPKLQTQEAAGKGFIKRTNIPGGFSITGEGSLVLGQVAAAVTPSAEQPTTVMPPNRLSVSAELLLVMLPHKDALSTCPDSESSSPAG